MQNAKEMIQIGDMKFNQKEFGKWLQDARKSKNISQKEISKVIGLGPNYISSLELGKYKCNAYTLIAYAEALDMSIDDIVHYTPGTHIIDELREILLNMTEENQRLILQMVKANIKLADNLAEQRLSENN